MKFSHVFFFFKADGYKHQMYTLPLTDCVDESDKEDISDCE